MPTMPPAARATGLTKVYGSGAAQVVALDEVTVDFAKGQFTAIMGPSGSGKSTLMHCVAGLDQPSSGEVWLDDVCLNSLGDNQLTKLRRDAIGFIFQSFNLVPTLSAKENILLPLAIAGRKQDQQWYEQIVETVGLGDRLHHKPRQLSGGQQQRVACARALVTQPSIIFADEPTGNLDSQASTEVLTFLRDCVQRFSQTIVMVTHDPTAASFADRVIFLADGQIVGELLRPTRQAVVEAMAALDPQNRAQNPGGMRPVLPSQQSRNPGWSDDPDPHPVSLDTETLFRSSPTTGRLPRVGSQPSAATGLISRFGDGPRPGYAPTSDTSRQQPRNDHGQHDRMPPAAGIPMMPAMPGQGDPRNEIPRSYPTASRALPPYDADLSHSPQRLRDAAQHGPTAGMPPARRAAGASEPMSQQPRPQRSAGLSPSTGLQPALGPDGSAQRGWQPQSPRNDHRDRTNVPVLPGVSYPRPPMHSADTGIGQVQPFGQDSRPLRSTDTGIGQVRPVGQFDQPQPMRSADTGIGQVRPYDPRQAGVPQSHHSPRAMRSADTGIGQVRPVGQFDDRAQPRSMRSAADTGIGQVRPYNHQFDDRTQPRSMRSAADTGIGQVRPIGQGPRPNNESDQRRQERARLVHGPRSARSADTGIGQIRPFPAQPTSERPEFWAPPPQQHPDTQPYASRDDQPRMNQRGPTAPGRPPLGGGARPGEGTEPGIRPVGPPQEPRRRGQMQPPQNPSQQYGDQYLQPPGDMPEQTNDRPTRSFAAQPGQPRRPRRAMGG